jgi:hypothetical protein
VAIDRLKQPEFRGSQMEHRPVERHETADDVDLESMEAYDAGDVVAAGAPVDRADASKQLADRERLLDVSRRPRHQGRRSFLALVTLPWVPEA